MYEVLIWIVGLSTWKNNNNVELGILWTQNGIKLLCLEFALLQNRTQEQSYHCLELQTLYKWILSILQWHCAMSLFHCPDRSWEPWGWRKTFPGHIHPSRCRSWCKKLKKGEARKRREDREGPNAICCIYSSLTYRKLETDWNSE